jgi:hypothetical protein
MAITKTGGVHPVLIIGVVVLVLPVIFGIFKITLPKIISTFGIILIGVGIILSGYYSLRAK